MLVLSNTEGSIILLYVNHLFQIEKTQNLSCHQSQCMIIPLYTYIFTDQLFDFLVHSFLNLIDILLFRPDLFQM